MKIAVLLLTLISSFSLMGQPTGEENYTKVELIFSNCSKDTLFFNKTDQNKFISKNSNYLLSFKTINMEDHEEVDITKNVWLLNDHLFIAKYTSSLELVSTDSITGKKWNLKIKLYKKKREMTVTLKLRQVENRTILIPFKKGNYEVIDPKKLTLIKVKN